MAYESFQAFFRDMEAAAGNALERGFERLEPRILQALRRTTPKRSGQAARAWRARVESPGASRRNERLDLIFENPLPYASFLDRGASPLAPRGITEVVFGIADRTTVPTVLDAALQDEFRRIDRR